MVVPVLAAFVAFVAVVAASVRDAPVAARPTEPGWDVLPAPSDARRVRFAVTYPGYDPAAVEATMSALVDAYEDLLAAAPPEVRARAWRRAAQRSGRDEPLPGWLGEPASRSALGAAAPADTDEALRVEVALAALGLNAAPSLPGPEGARLRAG